MKMNVGIKVIRFFVPLGMAIALLNGCPSTKSATTIRVCDDATPCIAGFTCVDKVCQQSLTCAVRTGGALNPTRTSSPKAADAECTKTSECAAGLYCEPFDKKCTSTLASGAACAYSDACAAGEYCNAGTCSKAGCDANSDCREIPSGTNLAGAAECVVTGCRSSSECSAGQKCIESNCVAPPTTAVASCAITTQNRSFTSGATINVEAIALDANGVVIPFQEFTLSTVENTFFSASGKSLVAKTSVSTGSALVTATFGSTTCDVEFFHIGDKVTNEHSRVVLYEIDANGEPAPIVGLTLGAFTFSTADGAASGPDQNSFLKSAGGVYQMKPQTAGVFEALTVAVLSYNVATVVYGGAGSNALDASADIVLPLERTGDTSGFGGKPNFTEFDQQFPTLAKDDIAIAYGGGSLPLTSLLNFNLDLFVGDTAPKKIDQSLLTPGTAGACAVVPNDVMQDKDTFPIPRALYASLGSGRIGVNCDGIAVRAAPGRRIGWSVGAKLVLTDITSIIPLVTSGGLSIASIVPAVLPLLDNFAIGNDTLGSSSVLTRKTPDLWNAYRVKSPADMQGDTANFPFVNVSPSRRLKFITNFDNPGLPNDIFQGATDANKMNAVITIVASLSNAYGIVPLGFGAGIDGDNNGQLDSLSATDTARFPANKVHVRNAAPIAELAEADIVGVSVALNVADLTAETSRKGLRFRGLIARDKGRGIGWDKDAPSLGSFTDSVKAVNFAENATYGFAANKITFPLLATTTTETINPKAVILRVSRTGATRAWTVIVNPARLASNTPLSFPTIAFTAADDVVCVTCGVVNATVNNPMTFTATSLDFRNVNDADAFSQRFGPGTGKDLSVIAGDTKSFSLYTQELQRQ